MLFFPLHLPDVQILNTALTPLFEAQQVPILALIIRGNLFFKYINPELLWFIALTKFFMSLILMCIAGK